MTDAVPSSNPCQEEITIKSTQNTQKLSTKNQVAFKFKNNIQKAKPILSSYLILVQEITSSVA